MDLPKTWQPHDRSRLGKGESSSPQNSGFSRPNPGARGTRALQHVGRKEDEFKAEKGFSVPLALVFQQRAERESYSVCMHCTPTARPPRHSPRWKGMEGRLLPRLRSLVENQAEGETKGKGSLPRAQVNEPPRRERGETTPKTGAVLETTRRLQFPNSGSELLGEILSLGRTGLARWGWAPLGCTQARTPFPQRSAPRRSPLIPTNQFDSAQQAQLQFSTTHEPVIQIPPAV